LAGFRAEQWIPVELPEYSPFSAIRRTCPRSCRRGWRPAGAHTRGRPVRVGLPGGAWRGKQRGPFFKPFPSLPLQLRWQSVMSRKKAFLPLEQSHPKGTETMKWCLTSARLWQK